MQLGTTLIFFILVDKYFRGGWPKNPKIISDQCSRHFMQFGKTLIFLFWTQNILGGGAKNPKIISESEPEILTTLYTELFLNINLKIISDQFSRPFMQFETTFIFFILANKYLRGGGIRKSFPINFLAISCNLEQL